jgi:hypothetical protein
MNLESRHRAAYHNLRNRHENQLRGIHGINASAIRKRIQAHHKYIENLEKFGQFLGSRRFNGEIAQHRDAIKRLRQEIERYIYNKIETDLGVVLMRYFPNTTRPYSGQLQNEKNHIRNLTNLRNNVRRLVGNEVYGPNSNIPFIRNYINTRIREHTELQATLKKMINAIKYQLKG